MEDLILVPKPVFQLTTIFLFSSRESDILFLPSVGSCTPWCIYHIQTQMHTQEGKMSIKNKYRPKDHPTT